MPFATTDRKKKKDMKKDMNSNIETLLPADQEVWDVLTADICLMLGTKTLWSIETGIF